MNTLVTLLKEQGYSNSNTNRERAVKNMNLLLDSGVMTLTIMKAEKYNDPESNWGYWYTSGDGLRRCTNYLITLYGQQYYGAFVPKKSRQKNPFGDTYVEAIDNHHFDVEALQRRAARLISKIRGEGDFLTESDLGKYGDCSCSKCSGRGILPQFMYYAEGICFDCGGSGLNHATLQSKIRAAIKSA